MSSNEDWILHFVIIRSTLEVLAIEILPLEIIGCHNDSRGCVWLLPYLWTDNTLVQFHLKVLFFLKQLQMLLFLASRHILLLVFDVDNLHEVVKHVGVNIVEIYFEDDLLLAVKHAHDASRHLAHLFVDPHEVRVGQVRPFTVDHVHVADITQHGGD